MLPADTAVVIPITVINDGFPEGFETLSWEIAYLDVYKRQDMGKSLVIVTHNADLAALSDHIYEMKDGLLISEL